MSDPHRLRSQSLVISSDKTLAARAALRIWVELMKRKRGPSWVALNRPSRSRRWRCHDARKRKSDYLAQRGRISNGMREVGVPDG